MEMEVIMKARYIIRLDDACPTMNFRNWTLLEGVLDSNNIKPIIGVIPHNEDDELRYYEQMPDFWDVVRSWQKKGYTIALHGYNHRYITSNAGMIPINNRSEFAGVPLPEQRCKIREGLGVFYKQGIDAEIFFAPSHSLDLNTLKAIRSESLINIISDGFAFNTYYENNFYWIPQQFWRFRKMPFGTWTVCIHPNTMSEGEFNSVRSFIEHNASNFVGLSNLNLMKRKRNIFEVLFEKYYFMRRKLKKIF
jgi:hypothetical protein